MGHFFSFSPDFFNFFIAVTFKGKFHKYEILKNLFETGNRTLFIAS